MFNLSGSELIFLVIIALVVLGPDKLPEAMRKAGKAYADFKKMTTGFQNEMKSVLDEPMRELRETAEMAKSSAMFDTKPFTDSIKDLGNTVTKPANKPAVKPVSASMAEATPVVAATPSNISSNISPAAVPTEAAIETGASATVSDMTSDTTAPSPVAPSPVAPSAVDDATARRVARATPPAISVSTTQVAYGAVPAVTIDVEPSADSSIALWPTEPDDEVPA